MMLRAHITLREKRLARGGIRRPRCRQPPKP
jgi:hypothetical protein